MRSYSKFRILLFALLLGTVVFATSTGWAEDGSAPSAADESQPKVNPFAILLKEKDAVSFTILTLSIAGLTLIIQGFLKARASVMFPEASTNRIREMISQRQFKELIEFTETDPSFVSKSLNPALKRAPSFSAMKEAMETAIGEQTADQFRRIEYLNIIGNLGPLLGLLGTVIGMIIAFERMNLAGGQATPAQLSEGIAKALAHTMAGLMLALPCLAAFGVLRTMIDRLTVRGALLAEELLLMIRPSEAKPMAAIVRSATPQPVPPARAIAVAPPPSPAQA